MKCKEETAKKAKVVFEPPISSADAKAIVYPGETGSNEILTRPDPNMDIRVIIDRFSKGLSTDAKHYETIYDDEYVPDFSTMDLAELADYREQLANERHELEEELRRRQAEHEPSEAHTPQGYATGTTSEREAPPTP